MNQNGSPCSVFSRNLYGDFGCPELHVLDFGRLKIVVDGYPILMRYIGMKWNILATIEYGLNIVFLEPGPVQRRLPTTYPHSGYNFINGIHSLLGLEGIKRHGPPQGPPQPWLGPRNPG